MGAVFDILHPSFKSALQRADEYLPADKCLKARRWWGVGGGGMERDCIRAQMKIGTT